MTIARAASPLTSFLGSDSLGCFVAYLLVADVGFALCAFRGSAIVKSVSRGGRSGLTFADVDLDLATGKVGAQLRAWYTPLAVGEKIPILYLADDPGTVALDRPWLLFFRPAIGLLVLIAIIAVEVRAYRARGRAWHNRDSLLLRA